ncbi:MAG: AAA family ATPase [Candidatus Binatia bacterium]
MSTTTLPKWAEEMRELFRSGSVAQFLLHGNVFDVVQVAENGAPKLLPLRAFLDDVMFDGWDVVLHYDRSRGIRASRGGDDFARFLEDALGDAAPDFARTTEPAAALELLDRYLLRTLNLQRLATKEAPRRIALVIDFAEFVVPRGDAVALGGAFSANVVKVLGWANDPEILNASIATVLVSEGLHDLSELVVENPHAASLQIPLPDETAMRDYLTALAQDELKGLEEKCDLPLEVVARRLTGLSRAGARKALGVALRNDKRVTADWLTRMKKEIIERECAGLLEFLESPFTLDSLAGNDAVKAWLREDAQLLRRGALHALPMGYLIAGRIGTGKTFLVQCWTGELGIPCVVLKNFRDRWVGATEANLERIFEVLRALGQVVVFVDEADQATGKRDGGAQDGGLSGRVYSMLAKEMSETRNRGRIMWVFATSRPDLVEVDLKRQGRLDVHIPLFPPETASEARALLLAIAKKMRLPVGEADLPELPQHVLLGPSELEGALVRAMRVHELSAEPRPPLRDTIARVLADVRPSAAGKRLEYMDMVAVKECTDARFLPARFRDMTPEEIEARLAELRPFV